MMGRLNRDQEQFFYSFSLDEAVPIPPDRTHGRAHRTLLAAAEFGRVGSHAAGGQPGIIPL